VFAATEYWMVAIPMPLRSPPIFSHAWSLYAVAAGEPMPPQTLRSHVRLMDVERVVGTAERVEQLHQHRRAVVVNDQIGPGRVPSLFRAMIRQRYAVFGNSPVGV
jgi:hypothetical protein